VLYDTDPSKRDPILAAVGQLQLEVVHYRLENEYGVKTRLEPLEFSVARWVSQGWPALEAVGRLFNCKVVRDCWDRPVLLFRNAWNLNQLLEDHPELALSSVAPVVSGVEPIAL
jgi:peptide chain release factor 3